MVKVAENILDREIRFIEAKNNRTIKTLSDIKKNLASLGIDRSARLIKHNVLNEIDTMFWTKFFDDDPVTAAANSIECTESCVFIGFDDFLVSYNIDPADTRDTISIKICSGYLKSDIAERWLAEIFSDNNNELPLTYAELKNYKVSDDNYIKSCENLKILEDFRNEPSMTKYCKLSGRTFTPILGMKPSFRREYAYFLDTISEDIRYALAVTKSEREKAERASFGLEQSLALYERAIPEIVEFLSNFKDDLTERLVVENSPFGNLLKAEILERIDPNTAIALPLE